MFELMVETTFAAAHQLRGYKGKCERVHGHNWKVQVHVIAERLNDIDIAMDFHDLKNILNEVIEPLDLLFKRYLPIHGKNPSSENMAKWIYDSLNKKLSDEQVQVSAVTVWESDSASATYYED